MSALTAAAALAALLIGTRAAAPLESAEALPMAMGGTHTTGPLDYALRSIPQTTYPHAKCLDGTASNRSNAPCRLCFKLNNHAHHPDLHSAGTGSDGRQG